MADNTAILLLETELKLVLPAGHVLEAITKLNHPSAKKEITALPALPQNLNVMMASTCLIKWRLNVLLARLVALVTGLAFLLNMSAKLANIVRTAHPFKSVMLDISGSKTELLQILQVVKFVQLALTARLPMLLRRSSTVMLAFIALKVQPMLKELRQLTPLLKIVLPSFTVQ